MKTREIILLVFVWIGFALLQTLSVLLLADGNSGLLAVDSLLRAVLSAVAAVAVKSVVEYAGIFVHLRFQKIINNIGLLLFFTLFTVGLAYLFDCMFFTLAEAQILLKYLPLNILISILLFGVIYFYFAYRHKVEMSKTAEFAESLNVENLQSPKEKSELLDKITVKTAQKLNVISISEIMYLQADGDYVQIHSAAGKFLKEQTMKYFADNLPQDNFVRIHRSFIVNINYISRLERYGKQTQILTLKNGEKLKVSPAGYQILKNRLKI
ncbi:MAG: LytTR family transcriptional regulator DNA-binding domain-containing protein [Paludibacter sp.]|jgi:hypothetical protein|nr:LytTR family transcriptional regulator DNA-binding domain-containing protein [Paludibacter sp.]